ncbi:hypothetical protein SERLA73DRAFT_135125 [Serpula lacrymans var. lacrymans S7.3]|uniref:Uncharacterized protein n=2 Tax=Serpula lacrymans var. lacrymans TaxID=341189 RepID=F8PUX7_SERL3|nr:uncharacterized protein SERLADRAFT_387007 [Serpula lacrymans var. lacrymans S7.9]EGN99741.1 hypothetical protein SERLA73DRAFT_135125 [Serpula lacrymans var. lacrymans S7.3]EGO25306.1 hypothetical protein SERLADRAFT_387007 [Serpula lacrymans var. lacrymans S7.9]
MAAITVKERDSIVVNSARWTSSPTPQVWANGDEILTKRMEEHHFLARMTSRLSGRR